MHIRTFVVFGVFAISIPATADSSSPTVEAWTDAIDIGVDVNVRVQPSSALAVPVEPPIERTQLAPTSSPRLTGTRWEGGVMFELGRFGINHVGGLHYGLRAHVGRQLGPLRIAVEGTFAKFSGAEPRSWDDFSEANFGGELHRIGVGLRYRGASENEVMAVAGYIEVGAGRQRILWNGGGETLDRSDVMVGLGYEIVGGRRGFGGMDMGMRFMASPTVERDTPGCIQICATTATSGDRTRDLGLMFVVGALFGAG